MNFNKCVNNRVLEMVSSCETSKFHLATVFLFVPKYSFCTSSYTPYLNIAKQFNSGNNKFISKF